MKDNKMKAINFLQDSHKLNYHMDRVLPWLQGERVAPIHLEIGTGPACNFKCVFCFTAFQKGQTYSLSRNTFYKIMKDAADAGVRSIGILGDGEPTLNTSLPDAIQYGASLGLDIGLATNGLLFDGDLAEKILPHLAWLRFTTCAANPKTFKAVHGLGVNFFRKVITNIETAVRIKHQKKFSTTLGIQMVLVPENVYDVQEVALMAKDLGVDYFVAKQACLSPNNEYRFNLKIYDDFHDKLKEVESYSTNQFRSIVAWGKLRSHGEKPYDTCLGYAFLLQVTGAGEVYPCSELVGRSEFLLGNFNDQTLLEMINGDRYKKVTGNMALLDMEKDCATCCRHDAINEFLWKLKNPPDHINFI